MARRYDVIEAPLGIVIYTHMREYFWVGGCTKAKNIKKTEGAELQSILSNT